MANAPLAVAERADGAVSPLQPFRQNVILEPDALIPLMMWPVWVMVPLLVRIGIRVSARAWAHGIHAGRCDVGLHRHRDYCHVPNHSFRQQQVLHYGSAYYSQAIPPALGILACCNLSLNLVKNRQYAKSSGRLAGRSTQNRMAGGFRSAGTRHWGKPELIWKISLLNSTSFSEYWPGPEMTVGVDQPSSFLLQGEK